MCLFRPSCGVPPPTQFLPTHDGTGLGWHTDVHYVKKNFSAHIYKIGMGHSWFIWVGHYSTFLSLLVSFPDPRLLLPSNQWSGNETIYSIYGQNDVQRGQAYGCRVESQLLLSINCTNVPRTKGNLELTMRTYPGWCSPIRHAISSPVSSCCIRNSYSTGARDLWQ